MGTVIDSVIAMLGEQLLEPSRDKAVVRARVIGVCGKPAGNPARGRQPSHQVRPSRGIDRRVNAGAGQAE
jgi:hypothetical protein